MKKEGNDEGRDPTQKAHVHSKHFRKAAWRIHERPNSQKGQLPPHLIYWVLVTHRSCDFKDSPETTRDCILVLTVSIGCAKNDSAPPDRLPAISTAA